MKYIIRVFIFNVFSLWLTAQLLPGVLISQAWQTMLWVGFVLTILMLIVKPILSILFIPINIMTFGFLSWAINVIVLYILTIVEPSIRINAWTFPGFQISGFIVPQLEVSYLMSLIITTFVLTCFSNFLHKVSE